ncbi:hypothetical protein AB1Y20_008691 [Prymnesium parvum]|uniref:Uncharacterized protein n=1 Tax=Prymnesium parvum TaxID=97485 RepID=A0AB34ITT6_PRYPA
MAMAEFKRHKTRRGAKPAPRLERSDETSGAETTPALLSTNLMARMKQPQLDACNDEGRRFTKRSATASAEMALALAVLCGCALIVSPRAPSAPLVFVTAPPCRVAEPGLSLAAAPQRGVLTPRGRSVCCAQDEVEAVAAPQWVQGTLSTGETYWWWYSGDDDDDEDAEIALERPADAWSVGELPDGRRYTWRDADDPEDPEVVIWSEGTLSSGKQFWFSDDGTVSLTDPFDLSIVQKRVPGDAVDVE